MSKITFYRIRHKPTGLYFCPVRKIVTDEGCVKSNLSTKGKLYFDKPNLTRWLEDKFYSHQVFGEAAPKNEFDGYSYPFNPDDWELVYFPT